MELDLQSLFGLQVHSSTQCLRPATPPPRIWAHIRRRYWSAKMTYTVNPEIYRDYPRSPSFYCCARNIFTVLRETLTQYITFNTGGIGESVLLYSVVCNRVVLHRPKSWKVGPLYLYSPSL
jgi:hypothetical protein